MVFFKATLDSVQLNGEIRSIDVGNFSTYEIAMKQVSRAELMYNAMCTRQKNPEYVHEWHSKLNATMDSEFLKDWADARDKHLKHFFGSFYQITPGYRYCLYEIKDDSVIPDRLDEYVEKVDENVKHYESLMGI